MLGFDTGNQGPTLYRCKNVMVKLTSHKSSAKSEMKKKPARSEINPYLCSYLQQSCQFAISVGNMASFSTFLVIT